MERGQRLGHPFDGGVNPMATLTLAMPKDGLADVRPLYVADLGLPVELWETMGLEVGHIFADGRIVQVVGYGGRELEIHDGGDDFVAMLVQFFLTSFIMTHFGLTRALLVLPIAVLLGSAGFFIVPILWVGSLLNTADGGFAYSINQSAKEALYVPTTRDEKYKAKAFIDMFVQRFAKAVAVGVSLGITTVFTDFSSIRWLSGFTIPIIIVWIFAVRYAGRKFKEMTEGG